MILPPHDLGPATTMQAPAPDGGWIETLKLGGVFVLGVLASFVGFRTQLYGLKRDIKDREREHAELKRLVEESVARIEKSIRDRRDDGAVADQRAFNETRNALNAIRQDSNAHHAENKERLRVMREQMFTVLRLVVKMARVIPGMNQSEVDDANAHFLALEVERAD